MTRTMPGHFAVFALAVVALLVTAACRQPSSDAPPQDPAAQQVEATISGTVTYRERVALTDRAVVDVSLEDVSRQDVAATVLARQVLPAPGQVPIRFELVYSPADIDERRSYAVRATIRDRGRLLFTSDTNTPVLTRGAGREAHLVLKAVQGDTGPSTAAEPQGPGLELEGMFSYLADAPRFSDCRTGLAFPVSMEGAFLELENAYTNSGIVAPTPVYIRVRGRYLERPSMEENRNEVKLIVDVFEELDVADSCSPAVNAELLNTYWRLRELGGEPVVAPDGMREAHLLLAGESSGVRGHAGCNDFFGSFETTGDLLSFSALGTTMMACPDGMDTEQAFFQALDRTTRYAIEGLVLTLYAGDEPLARLEATYL